MNLSIKLIIILMMTIVLNGESQELQLDSLEMGTNWKSYKTEDFSIKYPKDWDLDISGLMGSSMFLFSKLISDKDDFKENLNVMKQDLSAYNVNMNEYVKVSEKQIETMFTDGKLLESVRKESNGEEFHKLIYTGKQGIYNLKFEQYFYIRDKIAYVITLTCKESEFVNYQSIGERILNSFRFVDNDKIEKKM